MDDMIDKVARALVIAKFGPGAAVLFAPVPEGFPNSKEAQELFSRRIGEARAEASAAIEAMRLPTDEMIKSGLDALPTDKTLDYPGGRRKVSASDSDLRIAFPAMVDAVLASPGKEK